MRTGFFPSVLAALVVAMGSAAQAQSADRPQIVIQTSMGDVTVALDRTHAPATVDNFLRYASEGHYDGTLVYRVVPGFVIQAGSFDSATHTRPTHDPIPLEADNGLGNVRGTIAMARESDPNSATAEFFINLVDNTPLDHAAGDAGNTTGYTVFGHVVAGMDTVDKIASVPLGEGGPMPGAWPANPVTIEKVSILDTAPAAAPLVATPQVAGPPAPAAVASPSAIPAAPASETSPTVAPNVEPTAAPVVASPTAPAAPTPPSPGPTH